ncbi:MAG: cytochrome c oxidase accessory protein CcoG [Bdellovibrionales bacterium]|nr:cytochrome c oxidase accessory protein CcoG [Bdellovibrionales bacterium]
MGDEDFKQVLYTINSRGERKWVYPQIIKGFYFHRRRIVAYALILFYLCLPWIQINGKQAVHINIPERLFIIFGHTFWATDTIYLAIFFAFMGLCLFFFTSVFGRVWCGWACPETVFLEFVFRPIEILIEGSPAQRLRLDQAPWTFSKIRKKFMKHFLCAAFAWIIGSTALAYFIGRDPLLRMMQDWPWHNPGPFGLTMLAMGVMAFQFGWFREQFCTILCPYARFQSVLMDQHTVTVGYDVARGEPRGKKAKDGEKLGDCIDCGLCVRVCPTGIDIRNGNQLECISCTACIDACDSIMEQLGRAPGLIRYDSEAKLAKGEEVKGGAVRRTVYAVALGILVVAFLYQLMNRQTLDVTIIRGAYDKPYTYLPNGQISNHVSVRVTNKSSESHSVTISTEASNFELITPINPYKVPAGVKENIPLFIRFPFEVLENGKARLDVKVVDKRGEAHMIPFTVIGPDKKEQTNEASSK